jgi:hypothetical protein
LLPIDYDGLTRSLDAAGAEGRAQENERKARGNADAEMLVELPRRIGTAIAPGRPDKWGAYTKVDYETQNEV